MTLDDQELPADIAIDRAQILEEEDRKSTADIFALTADVSSLDAHERNLQALGYGPPEDRHRLGPQIADDIAADLAAERSQHQADLAEDRARISALTSALRSLITRIRRCGGYATPEEQEDLYRAERVLAGDTDEKHVNAELATVGPVCSLDEAEQVYGWLGERRSEVGLVASVADPLRAAAARWAEAEAELIEATKESQEKRRETAAGAVVGRFYSDAPSLLMPATKRECEADVAQRVALEMLKSAARGGGR